MRRARAAEHSPARLVATPAAQTRLRFRLVSPVDAAARDRAENAGGYLNERRAILGTRLDEADTSRGVDAQPVGKHASRGTAADDDGLELHGRHFTV